MSIVRNKCLYSILTKVKTPTVKSAHRSISTTYVLSSSSNNPVKTSLYDFHIKNGGKMVDFAGHLLPVQYSNLSVSESHLHTRSGASLFDVSHMLQTLVKGKDCIEWFETLCPVDLKGMAHGSSALTVFLNDQGGILDDLIVTKIDDDNLYIVSNAGRMEHDKQHMSQSYEEFKRNKHDVHLQFLDVTEQSLIALQGPQAAQSLQQLCKTDLSELYFMNSKETTVAGIENCRVTRCGYTGEDGFEISMPSDKASHVCNALLQFPIIKLAGLGARDSLRLEAGLCLYGNDIYDTITPVEASLSWLIPKRRRGENNFPGSEIILKQLKEGVSRRRVGLRLESGPPARRGVHISSPGNTEVIGTVTSGCPSPSLGGNIAMGYVQEEFKKLKTNLLVSIRNRNTPCYIAKMPFTPARYYIKNK